MSARFITIVFLSLIIFSNDSNCTIINVPADQPTIQQGIIASSHKDTVLVAPGEYFENINFLDRKIVLSSHFLLNNDPQFIFSTIINGSQPVEPDSASCIRMNRGQDSTTIIQGFTLTGGTGTIWTDPHGAGVYREGGGILTEYSSPTIKFNYIVDNVAIDDNGLASAGGGGIRIGDGRPHILNNIIWGNQGRYGAGIVFNYSSGIVRNNIIAYNFGGEDFSGGGIWRNSGGTEFLVENNTIVYNHSNKFGGAIHLYFESNTIIRNNIIWGNTAPAFPQLSIPNTIPVDYNIIEGGWVQGTNILDIDPDLFGRFFFLQSLSPAIDQGNPDPSMNDNADLINSSLGAWPSRGTLLNDLGCYGGPNAFSYEFISLLCKPNLGESPLLVEFEAKSVIAGLSYEWDLQDGTIISAETFTHTYNTPGLYDVFLTTDTGTGSFQTYLTLPILASADTVSTTSVFVRPGEVVSLPVVAINHAPLHTLRIPVSYGGELELTLDSITTSGCRTDYFQINTIENLDIINKTFDIFLRNSSDKKNPLLPAGIGDIVIIYFTASDTIEVGATADIMFSNPGANQPIFEHPQITYNAVPKGSTVTALSCCIGTTGNVDNDLLDNVDIADLTKLIDYLFISFAPPVCIKEANIDGELPISIDISDLTALIDFLFINFTPTGDCP